MLGLAVMILAVAILEGFRATVQDKVFSFDAHLNVAAYQLNPNAEPFPITVNEKDISTWSKLKGVKNVHPYILKPALLRTDQDVQGVLLKGLSSYHDSLQLKKILKQGKLLKVSALKKNDTVPHEESLEIVTGARLAKKLNLSVGQEVIFFFLQKPPKYRKVKVTGIFETGLEDFDENIALCDAELLRGLNKWEDSLYSGCEITLSDPSQMDEAATDLAPFLRYDQELKTIKELHPHIFDWLQMIGRNVEVLVALIIIVACFNMISTLLMLMLERTQLVGILKAIGAAPSLLQQLFMFTGLRIVVKGVIAGNLLGIGLAVIQYFTRIIPLDGDNYYMEYVPISFNWLAFGVINLLVLGSCALALAIPASFINRIIPAKAIKFQ